MTLDRIARRRIVVRMRGLIAGLVTLSPSLVQVPDLARSSTSTSDASEVFVEGCEVYVFGSRVAPLLHDGKQGVLITLTGTSVSINGRVYVELGHDESSGRELDTSRYGAYANKVADVAARVVNAVRHQLIKGHGEDSLLVDGVPRRIGEPVQFAIEYGETVFVAYHPRVFKLAYDRTNFMFTYEGEGELKAAPLSGGDTAHARRVFDSLAEAMKPGSLVLLGRGYRSIYRDPSIFADLRSALAAIPTLARRTYVDPDGQVFYEPLQIGKFYFSGSEVRDFVSAAGESK